MRHTDTRSEGRGAKSESILEMGMNGGRGAKPYPGPDSDVFVDVSMCGCCESVDTSPGQASEGESDSETEMETETDGEEDTDEAKESDKLEDILEYGLHNPYQLMFSEEDDENPNESEGTENTLPIVSETTVLLDEDQQSEEKPEANKDLAPSHLSPPGGFHVSTNLSFK